VLRVLSDRSRALRVAAERRDALAPTVDWNGVAATYARLLEITAG
jgi:hypothetical protein